MATKMVGLKGEPLVRKLAMVAKYAVFPTVMIAAIVYSYPDYSKPNKSITSPN